MTSTYPSGVVSQDPQGVVVARFASVGGALVLLTRHEDKAYKPEYGRGHDHAWQCLGCGLTNNGTLDYVRVATKAEALNDANRHAADCRAVPERPECAAPATAAAVLELAETVRGAVGELGSRVTAAERTVDEGLEVIAEWVASLADRVGSELAELCGEVATEVAETGAAVQALAERPHRSWWGRTRRVPGGEVR